MKQVLYLSYDGMTDPLGQSQVLPYLSGLREKGFSIHLLSAEKDSAYQARRENIGAYCKSSQIHWHPIPYTRTPPVISTLIDMRAMYRQALRIIEHENIGLLHCRSYIAAIVGLYLKKRRGIPLIFDMRGFWVDERVEGRIWNLKNPLYRIIYRYFKRKEKELLGESDAIVSLTHKALPFIHSHSSKLPAERITVIPCCTDTTFFAPLSPPGPLNPLQIKMGYLGSLSTWYMPDEMMKLFSRLLRFAPQSTFTIITREKASLLDQYLTKYNIDAARVIIQAAERSELPALMNDFDFSVCFIPPSFSKQASSPVKIGELMSMGVPVICNAGVGDLDELFGTGKNGVLVNDFSSESLDTALHQILEMKRKYFDEIRRHACEAYSLHEGVNRYARLYRLFLNDDKAHSG